MSGIDHVTLEAPDRAATEAFVEAAFGPKAPVRTRAGDAPTSGFRGFTLSIVVSRPAAVDAFADAAVAAGATVLKPAKPFWGYGGVVQGPDGTIWTLASSSKKDRDPATREIDELVLQLGVDDVAASKAVLRRPGSRGQPCEPTSRSSRMADRKKDAKGPKLLSGGNPQIPKGDGDGPVRPDAAEALEPRRDALPRRPRGRRPRRRAAPLLVRAVRRLTRRRPLTPPGDPGRTTAWLVGGGRDGRPPPRRQPAPTLPDLTLSILRATWQPSTRKGVSRSERVALARRTAGASRRGVPTGVVDDVCLP
jgi:catechol 2,3-dioxygenase-like lactoylglutathione lyase family enzyme